MKVHSLNSTGLVAIGRNLTAARKSRGLSQVEAAAELGYSNSSQLSKIESAASVMTLPFLIAAAALYKVPASSLLDAIEGQHQGDAPGAADRRLRKRRPERQFIGERFGSLTVTERLPSAITGASVWKCLCDCGKERAVQGNYLIANRTHHCGSKVHPQRKSRRKVKGRVEA